LTSVPAEIGQLRSLELLYLRNNQLTSIPAEIGQLPLLRGLWLDSNQLTSIPVEVGRMRRIDGGVGPQRPWRGRLRSSSRWKMVFRIGLILKFHRCIGQHRPSARASSEDGLASYHRLHVSWVYARRLRARQAQR